MEFVESLCKQRSIASLDISTPLLIPSFSSKGFSNIGNIWKNVTEFMPPIVLISSYDIFYTKMPYEINNVDIVFIDSGGYEATIDRDFSDIYATPHNTMNWDIDKHKTALTQIETLASKVVISFDRNSYDLPLEKQIQNAKLLFDQHPESTSDFLIKPYKSNHLSTDEIEKNAELLTGFHIIGVTEKELGPTIECRIQNLIKLRAILDKVTTNKPIHVFGCFDPLSIWLFYLCGADIFDGLAWLRFSFYEAKAIYRQSYAILKNYLKFTDSELEFLCLYENLQFLENQRLSMIKFAKSYDWQLVSCFLKNILGVLTPTQ
jgi:hypothetical protein